MFAFTIDAQDLNSDLSKINVDNLTDAQVRQFLDRAESSGMTLEQLELLAQQKGMSSLQTSKLRARIRKLQSGSSGIDRTVEKPTDRLRESYDETKSRSEIFSDLKPKNQTKKEGLQNFGFEFFDSSNPTFEPSINVATPENYILGPGDEIIIDIYGASETTYQQVISPDGRILISGVGPIALNGISVKEARNRVFNKLSTIYSGVKGRNPNTFIQFSIGSVRTIKVNVTGNVVQPGTYTLSSFSTAFNALYSSGGPSETGSLRNIDVIRDGEKIADLDVYKYLYKGDKSQNPSLQDQDIIVVKTFENRVKLTGNVKQPAVYELLEGETIKELLDIAGGFKDIAFKENITIDRVTNDRRSVKTAEFDNFSQTELQNGDSIYVSQIVNEYNNRVSIEGAVKRSGHFELTEGLMLSELIERAAGLREDAYLGRGNVIRLNDNLTLKNLSFDVKEVQAGSQDILLSPNDIVRISSIFELNENQTIALRGEVRESGTFPFVAGMTVEDLINLSGGLNVGAHTASVEIARRLTDNSDLTKAAEIFTFPISQDLSMNAEASGFMLEPFDLILVKSTSFSEVQKVVKLEGEVMFPGYYALETNEDKISDLIARAGGLTQYGYSKGATLIRRTEYFRTAYEKRELQALLDKRKSELESQYEGVSIQGGQSKVEVIRQELNDYEKELTEEVRRRDGSRILESRIYRAQQLRKFQQRDSITGSSELIEQEGIGIELDKILKDPNSSHDLILRDGDLISIPTELQTVRIQGEVLYPNTVKFNQGLSFRKYVSMSGGFADGAKPGKSYVVYANGTAQRTKRFLWFKDYPEIEPGADIIIPRRRIGRRLSVTEIVGIASSMATLGLLIDRLIP